MRAGGVDPAQGRLRLVEHPAPWLRFGGGAFLVAFAAAEGLGAAVAPEFRSRLGALLVGGIVAAALLALAAWWVFAARVEVLVEDGRVDLAGPGWRRQVQVSEISGAAALADSGLSAGVLNWPVTRSGGVTRLSMGGTSGVEWAMRDGHRYCVLTSNPADARRLLAALKH